MKLSTSIFLTFFVLTPAVFADSNSDSNLEIVKGTYAPPSDNLLNALSENIHWIEMENGPYCGKFDGKQAITENIFSNFGRDWEGFHPEPDNFIANGDTVVVTGTYIGMFKPTGKSIAARFTHIFKVANGKIIHFEQFTDTHLFYQVMN